MNATKTAPRTIQDTLGQSFTLPNGSRVKNRLVKSAMSETLAPADNRVPATIPTLYERWARGGIGLMMTGNVMVDRRALGEPGNVAVEDERDMAVLERWAAAGKTGGAQIHMQINHPGRQVPKFLNKSGSVAPSAVPFSRDMRAVFPTPRALSTDEIGGLVQRFARTAEIANKAGFDGVQIHGAHGYLVSQFLSPLTNVREDEWGGSAANRRRFVIELVRAIRGRTASGFALSIKINSADFQKGGLSEAESTEAILALAAEGMDFIEISGGTYEAPQMVAPQKGSTRVREAYFLSFAESLRRHLDVPLVVTGGFRTGRGMADAIESGATDFAGLARTLAINPDFPNQLLSEGDVRTDTPPRKTGIRPLDARAMVELTWYERQLHRMAKGRDPRPEESPLRALLGYSISHGTRAFRTRRAR